MGAIDRRVPLLTLLGLAALLPLAPALLPLLRLLDSGVCAQLATHTLHPGGIALPLCARDTGIYTGAALSFLMLWTLGRGRASLPPTRLLIILLLGAIALMGFDGLNSVATDLGIGSLYPPANALRLATGLLAGTALALLLAPVIARAVFRERDARPPLDAPAHLLPYLLASAAAFVVIWSGAPRTLYPIALVSNAGLLAILGSANAVLIPALRRGWNVARPSGAVASLGLLVLVACFLELSMLAAVRSVLLG